jgi:hypothetical protein
LSINRTKLLKFRRSNKEKRERLRERGREVEKEREGERIEEGGREREKRNILALREGRDRLRGCGDCPVEVAVVV